MRDTPELQGLLRAISENPHDVLSRLAYADWLEEEGRAVESAAQRLAALRNDPRLADRRPHAFGGRFYWYGGDGMRTPFYLPTSVFGRMRKAHPGRGRFSLSFETEAQALDALADGLRA